MVDDLKVENEKLEKQTQDVERGTTTRESNKGAWEMQKMFEAISLF